MFFSFLTSNSSSHWARSWIAGACIAAGAGTLAAAPQPLPRHFETPVATAMDLGRETRTTYQESPHSDLEPTRALVMANSIAAQIPGAKVFTVLPTGSMRPIFDEKAYVVVEPAAYEDLHVGDIVTFEHPRLHTIIVHRILEKRPDGYWTKGDHNELPDNVYVTTSNYRMRVFAIIYAKENGNVLRPSLSARPPGLTR